MPLLDVSDVIADPDFSDDITIIRSNRSVGSTGRTVDSPATYYSYGSVQPAPEQRLLQIPEAERIGDFISVVTPFHLYSLTDSTAPDQIVWANRTYRVVIVRDWSAYGAGFVEGICQLISFTSDGP